MAEVIGCMFHFGQCIWRKIQELRLQKKYNNDSEFALQTRMLFALAYVPCKDVIASYENLINSAYYQENEETYALLLEYIEEVWVGKESRGNQRKSPKFSIELWNHYQSVINDAPRTNNAVEGWYNGFNLRVEACHLCIWKFIELMRSEQVITEAVIAQLAVMQGVSQRRKRKNIVIMISAFKMLSVITIVAI